MLQEFTENIAWLAVICGAYRAEILLLTAIMTFLMACVLLIIGKRALNPETWVKYFAIGFAIFSGQYVLYFCKLHLDITAGFWADAMDFLGTLGSPANNTFFLAVAFSLLAKKGWRNVFPKWAVLLALSSFILEFAQWPGSYYRFGDALFSIFCLNFMGLALFLNFNPRRRWGLPLLYPLTTLVYGAANLVYALHPLVLKHHWWPTLTTAVQTNVSRLSFADQNPMLASLDGLSFAIMFFLKVCLFFGALFLIMKCLMVFTPGEKGVLHWVTRGNIAFLTDQGVLRALGENLSADLATLYIRYPGRQANQVSRWGWCQPNFQKAKRTQPQLIPLNPPEPSIVGKVFETGEGIFSPNRNKETEVNKFYRISVAGMAGFVTMPIFYNGAMIACLNLEWHKRYAFTTSAVTRIRQMADLIAPTVHARRQLMALSELNSRLDRLAKDSSGIIGLTKEVVSTLQDILDPVACCFFLEVGFRQIMVFMNEDRCEFRESQDEDYTDMNEHLNSMLPGQPGTVDKDEKEYRTFYKNLRVNEKHKIARIGLVLGAEHNHTSRPSLGRDYLQRKAIGALLASTLIEGANRELSSVLRQLHSQFNEKPDISIEEFFHAVREKLLSSGVLWVGLLFNKSDPAPENRLTETEQSILDAVGAREPTGFLEKIQWFHLQPGHGETRSLLRLELPAAAAALWLGIARPRFGSELGLNPSPWRNFLEHLQDICDSALVRIENQQLERKASRLEVEAAEEGLRQLLIHSLGNIAIEFSSGANRINDMLPYDDFPNAKNRESVQKRIGTLIETAAEFSRNTVDINRFVGDERQRIRLMEPIKIVRERYQKIFRGRKIQIDTNIEMDVTVTVPLKVAYLVLVNLITNAAQAIDCNGRICLSMEVRDEKLFCHVTDDGPGIERKHRERIFEMGFSTRGGSGLGLPGCRTAIRRYGGDLTLEDISEKGTRFSVRFPTN